MARMAYARDSRPETSGGSLIDIIVMLISELSVEFSEPQSQPQFVFPPNFQYNSEEKTFRIPKSNGFTMDLSGAVHMDLYHQRQYTITLPMNDPWHLGYGEFAVIDDYFQTVYISPNIADGSVSLTFRLQQLKLFDLSEDEGYYIIRAIYPRERYQFIVVIDPGHGGNQPGAIHGGIRESDLNLAVTRQLLALIEQNEHMRAYTTRNSDASVDLWARPRLGNEVGDIFISIHHNANTNRNVYGTESFYFLYIPDDDYDYNGYADYYGHNDINHGTVDDIADNAYALSSRGLAEIMQRQLINRIGFRDRGIHNRRFVVLRYSQIPATLVELGFMSNQQELDIMRTEAFQRQAAQAIYNGLLEVFAHYPPPR